jgi:hypothetical protein
MRVRLTVGCQGPRCCGFMRVGTLFVAFAFCHHGSVVRIKQGCDEGASLSVLWQPVQVIVVSAAVAVAAAGHADVVKLRLYRSVRSFALQDLSKHSGCNLCMLLVLLDRVTCLLSLLPWFRAGCPSVNPDTLVSSTGCLGAWSGCGFWAPRGAGLNNSCLNIHAFCAVWQSCDKHVRKCPEPGR